MAQVDSKHNAIVAKDSSQGIDAGHLPEASFTSLAVVGHVSAVVKILEDKQDGVKLSSMAWLDDEEENDDSVPQSHVAQESPRQSGQIDMESRIFARNSSNAATLTPARPASEFSDNSNDSLDRPTSPTPRPSTPPPLEPALGPWQPDNDDMEENEDEEEGEVQAGGTNNVPVPVPVHTGGLEDVQASGASDHMASSCVPQIDTDDGEQGQQDTGDVELGKESEGIFSDSSVSDSVSDSESDILPSPPTKL